MNDGVGKSAVAYAESSEAVVVSAVPSTSGERAAGNTCGAVIVNRAAAVVANVAAEHAVNEIKRAVVENATALVSHVVRDRAVDNVGDAVVVKCPRLKKT